MQFKEAVHTCFKKYADFKGRASRSEYWYWTLFTLIVSVALAILSVAMWDGAPDSAPSNILGNLFTYGTLLPALAVAARRLHDVNRSGWWILIAFTGIGILLLLFWYVQKSDEGANDYGERPLS